MLKWIVNFLTWLLSLLQPKPPEPPAEPEPLIDDRVKALGVTIQKRNGGWRLHALWMTENGSWDTVPAWAKQWQRDTLGGDHHCYGRCEAAPVQNQFALVWPPFGEDDGCIRTPEGDGWANAIMAGQNWNPANGQGPYHWFCYGGDKVVGLGMPHNHHVSFFAVWTLRG